MGFSPQHHIPLDVMVSRIVFRFFLKQSVCAIPATDWLSNRFGRTQQRWPSYFDKKEKNSHYPNKQKRTFLTNSCTRWILFFSFTSACFDCVLYSKDVEIFGSRSKWKRGALPVATNLCVSALHHSGTAVAGGQGPRQMAGSSQWNATSASGEGKVLA